MTELEESLAVLRKDAWHPGMTDAVICVEKEIERLRDGLRRLKGDPHGGVGGEDGYRTTRIISYRALNEMIDALLAENGAADICPECGSGLLNGEHIAAYPCSQRTEDSAV